MNYTMALIASVGLPLVAALHRFAASYGYRYVTLAQARLEAFQVFVMMTIIVGALWIISLLR